MLEGQLFEGEGSLQPLVVAADLQISIGGEGGHLCMASWLLDDLFESLAASESLAAGESLAADELLAADESLAAEGP